MSKRTETVSAGKAPSKKVCSRPAFTVALPAFTPLCTSTRALTQHSTDLDYSQLCSHCLCSNQRHSTNWPDIKYVLSWASLVRPNTSAMRSWASSTHLAPTNRLWPGCSLRLPCDPVMPYHHHHVPSTVASTPCLATSSLVLTHVLLWEASPDLHSAGLT